MEADFAHGWRLRDGKVVGFKQYVDSALVQKAIDSSAHQGYSVCDGPQREARRLSSRDRASGGPGSRRGARVMGKLVKVASAADIPPGSGRIAVFNVGGRYHAIDDTCPHRGGPLSEGTLEGETVTCPWHGSKFTVTTGAVLSPPAREGVNPYPVRDSGGELFVEV